jgi:UDP-GlcNAc:undecaprenyl-phosphate GlcNAc-1-phosphate transferase
MLTLICFLLGVAVCVLLLAGVRKTAVTLVAGGRGSQFHHADDGCVPRFGGVGLAGAFVAVCLAAWWLTGIPFLHNPLHRTLALSSLAMFAMGLWDDFRPLGARRKLLLQMLIAGCAYWGGIQVDGLKNPFTGEAYVLGHWGLLVTIVWLVALTNLINLIDGIDGLAGGIGFMLMCLLAYTAAGAAGFTFLVTAGMAGALLGFLYFNFPPARIYLGDGGAYFLGFLIGGTAIVNSNKGSVLAALVAPLIALGLPILDTGMAIVRRGLRGLPIFRPDRKHIHHRLLKQGWSRRRAVLTLYAVSVVFLLVAFGVFWSEQRLMPLLFGVAFLVLAVAARSFGFIQEWFEAGKAVGNSRQLRKETRYAMALTHWLLLEAERAPSICDLWLSYQFVAGKLGFSHARFSLPDGEELWQTNGLPLHAPGLRRYHHAFKAQSEMSLELAAEAEDMPQALFDHLSDLAAEGWLNAVQRWRATNELPIRFDSVADFPPPAAQPSPRRKSKATAG